MFHYQSLNRRHMGVSLRRVLHSSPTKRYWTNQESASKSQRNTKQSLERAKRRRTWSNCSNKNMTITNWPRPWTKAASAKANEVLSVMLPCPSLTKFWKNPRQTATPAEVNLQGNKRNRRTRPCVQRKSCSETSADRWGSSVSKRLRNNKRRSSRLSMRMWVSMIARPEVSLINRDCLTKHRTNSWLAHLWEDRNDALLLHQNLCNLHLRRAELHHITLAWIGLLVWLSLQMLSSVRQMNQFRIKRNSNDLLNLWFRTAVVT